MHSKAVIKILALTHELSYLLSFSCLPVFTMKEWNEILLQIQNYCKLYTILLFMKEDTLAAVLWKAGDKSATSLFPFAVS
jgi:hypothetical protein